MTRNVTGGRSTYGHVVGILMNESTIPRIPGDPGHAETFSFPVIYEVLNGFPFEDMIALKKDHIHILIERAITLQKKGAKIVVTDCGLFGPYQVDVQPHLAVPFIGTALDMVPMLQRFLPQGQRVGIITGDTQILTARHLEASEIIPDSVVIAGMENCSEFKKVVIERHPVLDVEKMRQGVVDAALSLDGSHLGAVVLECTNLISFRRDIQKALNTPVFDLVTLIEFYVSGFELQHFNSRFIG